MVDAGDVKVLNRPDFGMRGDEQVADRLFERFVSLNTQIDLVLRHD